ncbi:uncharacterized protein METZ01_LOCUS472488, partial [marine metagenome]
CYWSFDTPGLDSCSRTLRHENRSWGALRVFTDHGNNRLPIADMRSTILPDLAPQEQI